jgi:hypothetical protein
VRAVVLGKLSSIGSLRIYDKGQMSMKVTSHVTQATSESPDSVLERLLRATSAQFPRPMRILSFQVHSFSGAPGPQRKVSLIEHGCADVLHFGAGCASYVTEKGSGAGYQDTTARRIQGALATYVA